MVKDGQIEPSYEERSIGETGHLAGFCTEASVCADVVETDPGGTEGDGDIEAHATGNKELANCLRDRGLGGHCSIHGSGFLGP
jgi:hypothetical protein